VIFCEDNHLFRGFLKLFPKPEVDQKTPKHLILSWRKDQETMQQNELLLFMKNQTSTLPILNHRQWYTVLSFKPDESQR
jgi:hypothetical protein